MSKFSYYRWHDKVGHNITQQNLSKVQTNAQDMAQEKDNDEKVAFTTKFEIIRVLLTTLYREFSTGFQLNAIEMERIWS